MLKSIILETFKDYNNAKEFLKNTPEPLKTKLRQKMIDDKAFTQALFVSLNKAYAKFNNRLSLHNFYVNLQRYPNINPADIIEKIDKYVQEYSLHESRGSKNPNSKTEAKIKELQEKEKKYFDTYKTKSSEMEKVKHLREMADIIEQIAELKKQLK